MFSLRSDDQNCVDHRQTVLEIAASGRRKDNKSSHPHVHAPEDAFLYQALCSFSGARSHSAANGFIMPFAWSVFRPHRL